MTTKYDRKHTANRIPNPKDAQMRHALYQVSAAVVVFFSFFISYIQMHAPKVYHCHYYHRFQQLHTFLVSVPSTMFQLYINYHMNQIAFTLLRKICSFPCSLSRTLRCHVAVFSLSVSIHPFVYLCKRWFVIAFDSFFYSMRRFSFYVRCFSLSFLSSSSSASNSVPSLR